EIPAWAATLFDPAVPGSFSHYFQTVSLGQLQIRGTVLPHRFTSDEPASAYLSSVSTEPGEYGRFVQQVLARVDQEIDLGRFDNDGPDGVPNSGDDDGFVDYLCLCVRSVPRNFIIGSATGIARLVPDVPWLSQDPGFGGGAILISPTGHGALLAEGGMAQTVGAMAHEFGHGLGLPDLYDTSFLGIAAQDPVEDSAGIGAWGLMGWGAQGWQGDDGPNPPSAWSLEQLGWIGQNNDRLVEIKADTTGLVVADLHQGGWIYKVPLPPEAPEKDGGDGVVQGYLLLEQRVRQASFYHRHLPAEGLLVWRIRPRSGDNSREEAKLVDLVCADGLFADAGYPLGRTADRFEGRDNLDFWAHDGAYVTAHGGNLGDATDPFDGVRQTRLDVATNPATTSDPLLAEATTGTALTRIRRQGEATVVDVALARWAGTIRGQARWTGEILVDGDLTVAPGGSLTVYAGTQVRFAGTDRLAAGTDPALCELRLQGDFEIVTSFSARYGGQEIVPVVFAAERPGDRWYGIQLEPGQTGEILVPEESMVLRDAVQGMAMPGAPAGAHGLTLGQAQIEDAVTAKTTGDGDGRLDPGETFALTVPVANWSLTPYSSVRVRATWKTSLVSQDGQGGDWPVFSSEVRPVYAGGQQLFHLPAVTLSPEAAEGEIIELALLVVAGPAYRPVGTLSLVVDGSYPRHTVRLELAGGIARDQASLVWADLPGTVQAQIEGEIAGAELLVHALPDGALLRTERMTLVEAQQGARRFTAPFQPASGRYRLGLRVRGANGATVFSPTTQTVWAVSPPATHPTLVLVGDGFGAETRESFGQDFGRLSGAASIAELSADTKALLEPLLAEYHDVGDLVVWAGRQMDLSTQTGLAGYLEQGGRLLLASAVLPASPGFATHLGPSLPCRTAGIAKSGTVHSLYDSTAPGSQYQARYQPLDLLPPATPLLLDSEGKTVGLRADQGAGRVVYLAVDLLDAVLQPVPVARRWLLATGLELLRRPRAPATVLEVPGRTAGDSLVLLPSGKADRVRATVAGPVAGAELVIRALPYLTPVLRVPMETEPSQGDTHAFAAGFELAAPGRYLLSVDLTGPDHERLLTPAHLQLWQPFHTLHPALLLAQAVYTAAEKAGLRLLFGAALSKEGVDVMTEDLPDEAWYDLLLEEYLGPGKVVAWHGVSMGELQLAAVRRFLERGGRLLLTSRMFHRYTSGGESFLHQMLGIAGAPGLGYGRLRTPDGAIELEVQYSSLELTAPARPLLLDEAGRAAASYLDNGTWRVCYLSFDLQRVGSYAAQPLVE
ncbi:MAG: immune inhibitor A domain-containing protein, partial [Candidatus Latescibacterota bacterium]